MSNYAREEDDGEMEGDQVEQEVEELSRAMVPDNIKQMRACKRCGILKTLNQFLDHGCENCPFLYMAEEGPSQVNKCTTAFFEGTVAVLDPRASWAARWIRVDAHLPGVYAIMVTGKFDREMEEDLENKGVQWRCRPAEKTN